ncbi:hypothetical protein FXW78_23825 [Rhodococcus opacus]|nr:hypothetical protein [Rhodococcus opacus]
MSEGTVPRWVLVHAFVDEDIVRGGAATLARQRPRCRRRSAIVRHRHVVGLPESLRRSAVVTSAASYKGFRIRARSSPTVCGSTTASR